MYDFVCSHCESTKYPEMCPMSYFDSDGTEFEDLVPYCQDCGEYLTSDQATEFFNDLDRSAL